MRWVCKKDGMGAQISCIKNHLLIDGAKYTCLSMECKLIQDKTRKTAHPLMAN
jgi:hypothetical protein